MEKLEDYQVDTNLGMPRRIAIFLDYAAKVAPGRPISYQLLTKIVMLTARIPPERDARVKSCKNSAKRAKPILMNEYNRGWVSHPGFGIRATTDNEDLARTTVRVDERRAVNSIKALDRSLSMVDQKKIQDKELKAHLGGVKGILKVMVDHDFYDKLLTE